MTERTKIPLSILITTAVVAAAVGVFLGVWWAKSARETVVTKPTQTQRRAPISALTPKSGEQKQATEKVSPLRETLQLEHELARIDPAEFPALIESELRNATDSDRAFKIAGRWVERDPDGFLEWLRQGRGRYSLQEGGHGLGLANTFLSHLMKEDPSRAWEVAGLIPDRPGSLKMDVLRQLLHQDPEQAAELVRANRFEVSQIGDSFGSWGQRDPIAIRPVLSELLPGPTRAGMIYGAVSHYVENPFAPQLRAKAVDWFSGLSPELQRQARFSLERIHSKSNPDAAKVLLKAWEEP